LAEEIYTSIEMHIRGQGEFASEFVRETRGVRKMERLMTRRKHWSRNRHSMMHRAWERSETNKFESDAPQAA
jgi:hypothetical protein